MKQNSIIIPLWLLLFALTALSGGYWDVWWHVMELVETFYTLPHLVIYASIFVSGITILRIVFVRLRKIGSFSPAKIKEAKISKVYSIVVNSIFLYINRSICP